MASDLNCISLVGRLTRDPELRHTPAGTAVCKLRLAYTRRIKAGGEWQDKSCYIDVVVWANQGEMVAQYMSKGRRIGVVGELDWREYEANDGSKRQAYEINARSVQFLDSKQDGEGGQYRGEEDYGPSAGADTAAESDFGPRAEPEDDIPFMWLDLYQPGG